MRDADYLIVAMLGAILITLILATEAILRQCAPRVLWVPVPGEPAPARRDPEWEAEVVDLDGTMRRYRR